MMSHLELLYDFGKGDMKLPYIYQKCSRFYQHTKKLLYILLSFLL